MLKGEPSLKKKTIKNPSSSIVLPEESIQKMPSQATPSNKKIKLGTTPKIRKKVNVLTSLPETIEKTNADFIKMYQEKMRQPEIPQNPSRILLEEEREPLVENLESIQQSNLPSQATEKSSTKTKKPAPSKSKQKEKVLPKMINDTIFNPGTEKDAKSSSPPDFIEPIIKNNGKTKRCPKNYVIDKRINKCRRKTVKIHKQNLDPKEKTKNLPSQATSLKDQEESEDDSQDDLPSQATEKSSNITMTAEERNDEIEKINVSSSPITENTSPPDQEFSENSNFSTLRSEKFIFDSGDAFAKNVNLPSQATENSFSSTLRSVEKMNLPSQATENPPVFDDNSSSSIQNVESPIEPLYFDKSLNQNERKHLMELEERKRLTEKDSPETDFLYPTLNDPKFILKIAKRKEFFHTKYDGTIHPIEKQANMLCNAKFELMPHQKFVKNFLSFHTPYNSLLLYHGLGSGKTCSAIGIAEEMRNYIKQIGLKQKIIIVASPNVQDNFRLQLFDERKLKKIQVSKSSNQEPTQETDDGTNDVWNIDSCVGNALINEINPTQLKGLSREKVIQLINNIIKTYYLFMGYGQLANYISDITQIPKEVTMTEEEQENREQKSIRKFFNNRLIIIDEVQNIRITDENNNKKTAVLLMKVAKYSLNMRLLLLSATPMYNSYKEIVWVTNLMNINDKRSTIEVSQIFDANGEFYVPPENTQQSSIESGRDLLSRKLTGYISYIRGENPYTFPYRIYPKVFSLEHSFFPSMESTEAIKYPKIQMNGKPIEEPMKYIDVYLNRMDNTIQQNAYSLIMQDMRTKSRNYFNVYGVERIMPTFENLDTFGYTQLLIPLEALNIVYPSEKLEEILYLKNTEIETKTTDESDINHSIIQKMIGKEGLKEVVNFVKSPIKRQFSYKKQILTKYGKIFHLDHLHNYSIKISNICKSIQKSRGVIMIYSQYIEGGIIPICLALEEMGFSRYCSNKDYNENFFKKGSCSPPIDAVTGKTRNDLSQTDPTAKFNPAKYIIISGDKTISPSNSSDIKFATDPNNKYGEQVKVIIISKAGSEGLDFNNIRQIHILESWYNMNRIEQIIGRSVRNLSHCSLPFQERNVEIYMHSTLLNNSEEEAADLYVYRLAEKKSIQIGRVSRLLKENSVDCLLNIEQTNFTVDKLYEMVENQTIELLTSSGKQVKFRVGDQPYTNACDYMDTCEYKCRISGDMTNVLPNESEIDSNNYNADFAKSNISRVMERIRQLFRENILYKREDLIREINIIKPIPIEEIYFALNVFLKNKNEFLYDKYGRVSNLVNKGKYYICMPLELLDENSSIFERSAPIEYKRKSISLEIPKSIPSPILVSAAPAAAAAADSTAEPELAAEVAEEPTNEYRSIMEDFISNFKTTFEDKILKLSSKDHNWYRHANQSVIHLALIYEIPYILLHKYIIYHMMDMLKHTQKLALYEHLWVDSMEAPPPSEDSSPETIVKYYVKMYFQERVLTFLVEASPEPKMNFLERSVEKLTNGERGKAVLLNVNNNWKIYIFQESSRKLVLGEPEDYKDFARELDRFDIDDEKLNDLVGFVNMFKNGEMVFKTKYVISERNNIGVRCGESSTKADVVKTLNFLLKENRYDASIPILHAGLCVILEILLRYKTEIEKESGKVYFLSPEETAINDIVKYQR